MKNLFAIIISALLLSTACKPSSPSEGATSASNTTSPAIPKRFWFHHNYEPSPGKRTWTMVDNEIWTEEFDNGVVSRFIVVGRQVVMGNSGTLVAKISGDPRQTRTPNDGGFQVFISDVGSTPMNLWVRQKVNGVWKGWVWLNEMQGVE